jgi:hypothetical protein
MKKNYEQYELSELPTLGYIVITWVGEENMYFTKQDGTFGFVKYHC